ncbi:MAG: PEP/pyruvate-binding domain-containing protein [Dehalobacterium sp.]|jgi:phosphoenolpyruvate synthase/pyruvate phosphate dikinase
MDEMILWLDEIKFRHQVHLGSKAVNLGLIARELKTPPGFCLSSLAYSNILKNLGMLRKITRLAEGIQGESLEQINQVSDQIRAEILGIELPTELLKALEEAYERLKMGRENILVAVRSSATAEDLPSASFAGQMDSYLNVSGFPELLLALKKCWASLWTSRGIHYRFQKGIGQKNIAMAVIVQEMVPAEIAGVMFTANPITNCRQEYYIEAVRGLGDALVSGESNADRYLVTKKDLHIRSKELVDSCPYMTDFQIKTLADYGAKLEFLYEEHQDIEWAMVRGEIYILQTRPITTLEDEALTPVETDKMTKIQKEIWTNINERFPEPILPMDGIVAKIYYMSLFNAYQELGFYVPFVDWRNVEQGIFPDFYLPPRIKRTPRRLVKYTKTLGWDLEKEWKDNEAAFDKFLRLLKNPELPRFPLEVILEYVEDGLRDFQRAVTFRYVIYLQYRSFYHLLSRLMVLLHGAEGKAVLEGLLSDETHITGELNRALLDLALKAKISDEIKDLIVQKPPLDVASSLKDFPLGEEYLQEFHRFLEQYGDRELSQGLGGIAAKTWRDRPDVVWGMIKGILIADASAQLQKESQPVRRIEAEEKLRKLSSKGIYKILAADRYLDRLIDVARKYNIFRENSHFYLTQGMTVFRTLFLEIGRLLVKRDLLEHQEDIMYLTYFELKEIIYALYSYRKVSRLELKEKIYTRKQRQERRRRHWAGRHVMVSWEEEKLIQGIGASCGVVSGPCKIIIDPQDFSRLRPGDILVALYTNPAWTPTFSFIGGLVAEYGSTVSHAAIIAREYGIPAVMGVKGATQILKDGEEITIDGSRGLIQRSK